MSVEIRDELDVLLIAAARRCGNAEAASFEALDTAGVEFDDSFRRKMKKIIKRGGVASPLPVVKKVAVRVAAAIVAIMALGFITVMAVPDLREALFETVIRWYDNYITIDFLPLQNSASDIAQPNVEAVMLPEYMPAGAERRIIVADSTRAVVDYFRDGEYFCTYMQNRVTGGTHVYDSQALVKITNVVVDGRSAMLLDYGKDECMLVWHDETYRYNIYARQMEVDEIIKMAESISPPNFDVQNKLKK